MDDKLGGYAFLAGIAIAVLIGLGALTGSTALSLLVLAGIAVGALNISHAEGKSAVFIAILLAVAGGAATFGNLGTYFPQAPQLVGILTNIGIFFMVSAVTFGGISWYKLTKG